VLKRLVDIIDSVPHIAKIYVRIDPSRMIISDVEQMAFMFFVERVQMHLKANNAPWNTYR
jgi:hypothetical protein